MPGPQPATLLKMRLSHRCFPVNFAKFLRAPFFTGHLHWLFLYNFVDRKNDNNQQNKMGIQGLTL